VRFYNIESQKAIESNQTLIEDQVTMNSNGGSNPSRNGRAGGSAKGSSKPSGGKKDEKPKFHPLMHGERIVHTFDVVHEHLVYTISKRKLNYTTDIVKSIKSLKNVDLSKDQPKMVLSKNKNEEQARAENMANQTQYHLEMQEFIQRKKSFEDNQLVVTSMILSEFVTKEMKDKLESEVDWESTLEEDPVELLKRIRKLMITSPNGEYGDWQLWERLREVLNCRQQKEESLPDFRKRFKQKVELLESLLGKKWLDYYALNSKEYGKISNSDKMKQQEFRDGAMERLFATGFVCNASREKTSKMMSSLRSAYVRGSNHYPDTLEKA